MVDNAPEIKIDNSVYDHFVGIKLYSSPRAYYFGTKEMPLAIGDKVVVETINGLELGEVVIEQEKISKYKS